MYTIMRNTFHLGVERVFFHFFEGEHEMNTQSHSQTNHNLTKVFLNDK